MSLDINKVAIKTSLASFFGSHQQDMEGLSDFFDDLAQNSEELTLNGQEYLFEEGDANEFVYIPVSGAIMLERATSTGCRQVFSFLLTGNILGVSEHAQYSFSAKTLTNAVVIKISQSLMKTIFDKYPAVAQRYQEITSHILAMILDQLFIMGQRTAHQRLAHFLMDMQTRLGHGTNKFHLPMSRQDIADYLGTSLETTSRGFSKLKSDGMIQIENNYQITVLDAEALQTYANK
ncbi:cyclic nucleotide-binding domain-containing protein [Thalassotalea sp. HSM 43]|uniref:Crp/Fnr family transcriptional regulator n=1 Tax=Thalassotalea sp. HSM 43 TaxID=2552945 RepID=UPI0010804533|nr:helix-turn-helix domain-containing protein [Thalassotalea sp. HSM 43]QBY04593.1 cyclic nucleotide-binding domain-containing protein [Thalassotalea sp. HSM 43]